MDWEPALPYAVLLQDANGCKENKLMFGSSFSSRHILRGTLLVRLSHYEIKELRQQQNGNVPVFNFKVHGEPTIKVYCNPHVVYLLNYKQKELLLAISSVTDRSQAVNKIEWAEKLTDGSSVYVNVPTIPTAIKGIVRYTGKLPGEPGIKFGVELLEHRYYGSGDGTFKDGKYFECERGCAVFVGLDRLSESHNATTKLLTIGTADSSCSVNISSKSLQKQKSVEQQEKQVLLKIGDRVMAFEDEDKGGGTIHGTVKWIGGRTIIGIETDVPVNHKKFAERVSGLHHMFTPSGKKGKEYQLFLPFNCVLHSKLGASQNAGDVEKNYELTTKLGLQYARTDMKEQQAKALEQCRKKNDAQNVLKLDDKDIDNTMNPETQQRVLNEIKQQRSNQHSQDTTPATCKIQQIPEAISLQPVEQASNHAKISVAPESEVTILPPSHKSTKVGTKSHHSRRAEMQKSIERIDSLEKALVEIQESNKCIKEQLSLAQKQLSDVQKNNQELQTVNTHLQNQLSHLQQINQQEIKESIQRMEINVDNAFRKALEVQKNNETLQKSNEELHKSSKELQESNAYLKAQLSLTQQQLLGVQSMMTCSRLWVASHDQFKIGSEIGRGAWASVHEATFRGAIVAAKCLHKIITTPRTRQLFQREMEMALHCQHQNIVTFLGATLEGHPVILMELMDTSLRSAYEQGHIRDHQVLGILYDTASALHFLHTRPDPIIHRDVSSANVLLKTQYNGGWVAKLGDLGTAKIQQQAATAGPGAIAYGAPEAADFTKHSPKMDVYSYGVLILEILTKTHPFQMVDALKVQVQQQFPQYHQLVTSCTNQKSSDRPTMYDVIGQLDRITRA